MFQKCWGSNNKYDREVYIDTQKEVIDLCNVMNNYAENLISQVQKNDEKIAQQDFDMAKMVDFLT